MRLIHGDALEIVPTLGLDPARTAIVSDPPYGMRNKTDSRRFSGGHRGWRKGAPSTGRPWPEVIGDDCPFDPTPWLRFPKVVLWGANHFARLLPVGTMLVWVKRNESAYGSFLSDAEVAWLKGGHGVYLRKDLSNERSKAGRLHPNQKPLSLMRWCIERLKVPAGWTILDPYAGSGTTLLAASQMGYDCVGIEQSADYFAVAQKRIAAAHSTERVTQ